MNPEQNRTEQNKPEKTSGRKKPSRELTKQEEFIKNHRRHHHEIASWRTVIFVLFLALWEISAGCGWIDSFFFSSPSRVARCFADQLRNNSMLSHIGVTLFETLLSFLLVLLFSLLISTMLWYSAKLSEILEPYLVVLNSLPKSALAPLFIVWLGTGTKTIIVAGMSVAVFGSIISFYTGFQQVDAGGRYHRRIPCRQAGAGIPDHLRLPGFPAGYGDHQHYHPVHYRPGILQVSPGD